MAVFYSNELVNYTANPRGMSDGRVYNATLKRFRATITLATQTTSDTIVIADVPPGYAFAYGMLNTDTSLGSSTVAIGITGTTGKYRAAAVFTATNTPTLFGLATSAGAAALSANEVIFITIAAANFPASGNLVVDMYFSTIN